MKQIIPLLFLAVASGCATSRTGDFLLPAHFDVWPGTDVMVTEHPATRPRYPARVTSSTNPKSRILQRTLIGTAIGVGLGAFFGAAAIDLANNYDFDPSERDESRHKGVIMGAIVGGSMGAIAALITHQSHETRLIPDGHTCGYGALRGPVQTNASAAMTRCPYGRIVRTPS